MDQAAAAEDIPLVVAYPMEALDMLALLGKATQAETTLVIIIRVAVAAERVQQGQMLRRQVGVLEVTELTGSLLELITLVVVAAEVQVLEALVD